MNAIERRIDSGALFTGLLLIGVGVLFLLDRLEIVDFGALMRTWWPMIIVLAGLPRLLSRRSVWSGLWLIAIGTWLQSIRLHLFGMTFGNAWPILLIVAGGGIALRAIRDTVPPSSKEERRRES